MNLKGILVTVLLLGIIAVASYFAASRSKPAKEGRGYTAILMCADPDCQKIFPQRIIAGQPAPYRCKACQKLTAYRAVRCNRCGTVFAYVVRQVPTESGPEETQIPVCPECGYHRSTLIRSMDELKKSATETQ